MWVTENQAKNLETSIGFRWVDVKIWSGWNAAPIMFLWDAIPCSSTESKRGCEYQSGFAQRSQAGATDKHSAARGYP